MSVEEDFVNTFVAKEKRERYLEALGSPKKRKKLLDQLNHKHDFHDRRVSLIADDRSVEELLSAKRAPNSCYVLADGHKFDGKTILLKEALEADHSFSFVIICDPGRLAVYWPESPSQAILLERKAPG